MYKRQTFAFAATAGTLLVGKVASIAAVQLFSAPTSAAAVALGGVVVSVNTCANLVLSLIHIFAAGYDGMTNMELRRKVGYRPRKRAAGRAATRHSARRSHAAFLALGEDACAAAWEMDTVEGAREDSACLLTLLHRPSRLQLALPLEEKTAGCVADALEGVRAILGADGTRRVFRAVLTDNGAEFSDEVAIAALLGEGPGETRLFYCDPGRSDQKGACERNHVEIRKLLPKRCV